MRRRVQSGQRFGHVATAREREAEVAVRHAEGGAEAEGGFELRADRASWSTPCAAPGKRRRAFTGIGREPRRISLSVVDSRNGRGIGGSRSLQCNANYRNELVLWDDPVARWPVNARAQNNFGDALRETGRFAEARAHFVAVRQLEPDFPPALQALDGLRC